jgi:prolyl-tRNA synthetase
MRGREFTMKDAYSFDRDIDGLKASYQNMYDAYVRIFQRFGLEFRAVAADNGAIGGSGSHEFHVIADTGEDAIVYCPTSDYAANMEAAEACRCRPSALRRRGLVKASTPGKAKCEHVAEFLNIPLARTVKSIVLATDGDAGTQIWLLLIRGDHELNEVKASKVAGLADFRFATESEIVETFGTPPGYLGPIGTKKPVKVVATAPSPT